MRIFVREYFKGLGENNGFIVLLKMIHAHYENFHLYKGSNEGHISPKVLPSTVIQC